MSKYNFPWLSDPEIQKLMQVFMDSGEDIRFVGGCIRNSILGLEVQDLDMATTASPDTMFKILTKDNIIVIPTGIDHGTVTVVMSSGDRIEITTLREDVKTDGRHAKVKYSKDWDSDAKRRDFTINALYLDLEGNVYDPTGLGLKDINDRFVRFIGDPNERIQEDYLRILRFFRFCVVCDSEIDENSLEYCIKNKDSLQNISRERVKIELEKLLSYHNCYDIVLLMLEYKIFDQVFSYLQLKSDKFSDIQNSGSWYVCNWLIRLVSLIDHDKISLHSNDDYNNKNYKSKNEMIAYFLSKDLSLSNAETKRIKGMLQDIPDDLIACVKRCNVIENKYDIEFALAELKKFAYYSTIFNILSALVLNDCDITLFLDCLDWEKPKLPINGLDVMKNTDNEIIIGTILHQVEKWWVNHNFFPGRDDCLFYMQKLISK